MPRFKSKEWGMGEKIDQASVFIAMPARIKEVLYRITQSESISMSRYTLNLILDDIRKKDEEINRWLTSQN